MTVDLNGADDALSTCLEIAPPPAESDGQDQGGASSATASLEARLASERDALIASLRAQYGLGEREGESEFGVSQEQTERLAEEQAERERLAEEQAERERIAAEQAATARGIAAYRRFQELANGSPEMRNLPLAFDFLRVAAEQGYVYAQHDLGYIYEHGQMGVQRSLQEAARWYEMAAAQGFEPSISRLERIAIDGPAYQPGPSTRHAAILTCTNGPNVEVSIMVCLENSVLSIVKNGEVSEYASGRNAHMNALNRFEEAGDFLGDALFIGLPADFLITTRNSARHQFTLSLFVLEVEEGEHWRSITDRTQVCRQHARSYGSTVTCQSPG
jgi:TPR repeat protein